MPDPSTGISGNHAAERVHAAKASTGPASEASNQSAAGPPKDAIMTIINARLRETAATIPASGRELRVTELTPDGRLKVEAADGSDAGYVNFEEQYFDPLFRQLIR